MGNTLLFIYVYYDTLFARLLLFFSFYKFCVKLGALTLWRLTTCINVVPHS